MDLDNIQLDGHINKCRCCFRALTGDQKFIKLNEQHIQKFFDLTQLQLIQDEEYSRLVCSFCDNDLEVFSNFRQNLIFKQRHLYSCIQPRLEPVENPKVIIKTEIQDDSYDQDCSQDSTFINCTSFSSVSMKIENDESISPRKQKKSKDNKEKPPKTKKTAPKKMCNLCGKTMAGNLRRHFMKVHSQMKNFFCDICDHGTYFKNDMEVHMKRHIAKVKKEQSFFCEICGFEFKKRSQLTRHVKAKHTVGDLIYQCNVCEKSFASKANLTFHLGSHNEKTMPCEFCGKLFSRITNLRTHLYLHSEPRFSCDFPECGKKFFMRRHFRAHLKTHRGQKDIQCEFCEKSYFTQNDLNRHIFSIHQKLRFFCEIPGCQGNFSRRAYYKKHALVHHQNLGQDGMEDLLQKIKDAIPLQVQ